jgi:murein DD-endopeptidase MepM/ murein hydrolase activator NlpD
LRTRSTRRRIIQGALIAPFIVGNRATRGAQVTPAFSLPIGLPGQVLGDGFLIRHGYACENTWYNTGWLHTAEDYYLPNGNTAGAGVYAVADGEIVFAGSEYPGLVVIVQHADDLFSMYGHLDRTLAVDSGTVRRGQLLGTVLDRTDGRVPSHLHFEVRDFLIKDEINGTSPSYGVRCGFNCAPGPGYWPIDAPEHPSELGWRNPTHVIANRAFDGAPPDGAEVVVASGANTSSALWSKPFDHEDAVQVGELPLNTGGRYPLITIATGSEASYETSADGYRLWYRIAIPDVGRVWVQAATPSTNDTGSDGRPSTVRMGFLMAIATAE